MIKPMRYVRHAIFVLLLGATGAAQSQDVPAGSPAPQLKANVAASQGALRMFTGIETTSVLVNGPAKSNKQKRVYYGADSSLQKGEIAFSPAARQKTSLRGAVAAAKKEEVTDYLQAAVALGRVSVDAPDPSRRVHVNMKSYRLQGDSLAEEFAIEANRPLDIRISTYLPAPSQVVLLTAGMGQMANGTTIAANITRDAAAKNLRVNVLNSGHRKLPERSARRRWRDGLGKHERQFRLSGGSGV